MNWAFIVLAYSSLFVLGLGDNSRGALYPDVLSFWTLSKSEGSLFFVVASVTGLLATLTGSRWLRLFGLVRSSQILILLFSFSLFGLGWAGRVSATYWVFLLFAGVFGFSLNGMGITINLLAVKGSSKNQTRILSGLHAIYGLSSLCAPLIVTWLFTILEITNGVVIFQYVSIVPFLVWLYSLSIKNELVAHSEKRVKREFSALGAWTLPLILALYVGAEISLSSRMSLLIQSYYKQSSEYANYYLSAFFFFLMLGRIIGAVKAIKATNYSLVIRYSLLFSGVCYALGLVYHPIFLVMTGLMMSLVFPLILAYISENFPDTSTAIIVNGMTAIGGVLLLFHWVIGVIADQHGIEKALWLGVGGALFSLVIFYFYDKKLQRK